MSVTVCLSPRTSISLRIGARDGPILTTHTSPPQIDFLNLSASRFHALNPYCVLTWLFHEKFDAFRIGRWLVKHNFGGVLYGVCHPLPRERVVIRDMQRAYPDLQFGLMIKSDGEINLNPYEETLRYNNRPPRRVNSSNIVPLLPA